MFKLLKKKTKIIEEDENKKTSDIDQDGTINYFFSKDSLPEKYRDGTAIIKNWFKYDGDFVKKGEPLFSFCITVYKTINAPWFPDGHINVEQHDVKFDSPADGILEISWKSPNEISNSTYLPEKQKIFTIYKNPDHEKELLLKNRRFKNVPMVKINEFTGVKEIKWERVAGETTSYRFCDFLVIHSNDKLASRFYFTFNNLDNKDYIVFRYFAKDFRLNIGSVISFLFENNEIINFEITAKPYPFEKDGLFEIKVQLTSKELEKFKTLSFIKWKIEINKVGLQIRGNAEGYLNLSDSQFCVKKLAIEYHKLVIEEIHNYQPLIERQEKIENDFIESEQCHVYLMIDKANNFYKIGISNKPDYREKTLQSEKPTIEMICCKRLPSRKIASSIEQALHQAYKDKRIRGEWFSLTANDIKEITDTLTS